MIRFLHSLLAYKAKPVEAREKAAPIASPSRKSLVRRTKREYGSFHEDGCVALVITQSSQVEASMSSSANCPLSLLVLVRPSEFRIPRWQRLWLCAIPLESRYIPALSASCPFTGTSLSLRVRECHADLCQFPSMFLASTSTTDTAR